MNIENKNRWTRSDHGWIAGVCQGLSESFGIETWVLRAIFLFSFFWLGTGLLVYLIAAFCLPKKENIAKAYHKEIAGVCAEIAIRYDFEIGLVRMAACFLAVTSFGLALLVYLILAITMPKDQLKLNRRT